MKRMSEPGNHPMPQPLCAAVEAQKLGRSVEAKTLAGDWLKRNPDDALALTILASTAIDLRRPIEAEHLLRRDARSCSWPPSGKDTPSPQPRRSIAPKRGDRDPQGSDAKRRAKPASTYVPLHTCSGELGQVRKSAETFEGLLKWRPDDPNLCVGYAERCGSSVGRPTVNTRFDMHSPPGSSERHGVVGPLDARREVGQRRRPTGYWEGA